MIPGALESISTYAFCHSTGNKRATPILWGYEKCSVLKSVLIFGKEKTTAKLLWLSNSVSTSIPHHFIQDGSDFA